MSKTKTKSKKIKQKEEERIIVTSALPYINGVKHLGNLIGSLLPADVYTRYLKLKGKNVIYICGTDDHGTPAEISALQAGKPVDEYCEDLYQIQKKIYDNFGLNFDYFGKTSDKDNHEITQEMFLELYKNGYISEKSSKQLYSVDEDRYLPDRYVIGTCPKCNYERARGDQCESCTSLLNPVDLINPKSITNKKSKIVERDVTHFYINLPKLQDRIEKWVESHTEWPTTTLSIARKWLKEGLRERAITRNLKWGIDVPLEGYDDLVFYVWFDAPNGYISMTKTWAEQIKKDPSLFEKIWKGDNTKLIQFMGIDNVPFHAVTWPGSLIGSDLGYIAATTIKSFQWLTYEKGKFSTSQNRGIFTDVALELYPADYWRYYLLSIAPERQDTDFLWDEFQNAVNNDLNNLLGNLLNRCVTFTHRHNNGKIPIAKNIGEKEKELYAALDECVQEYTETFDNIEFQKPIRALRKFWQASNKYFQEKQPWKQVNSDLDDALTTVSLSAHALRSIAILFAPIAPFSAEKIFESLGYKGESVHKSRLDQVVNWTVLQGKEIPELHDNLFTKIKNKDIQKLKERFGSVEEKKSSEKDVKKPTKKAIEEPEADDTIEYEDFAKVKLVTAKVLKVEAHPKADKLLVLTIDDGRRQDRTVCAGIKEFYKPEEILGKNVIIVDNLKPRKLRGVMSEGMVLACDIDEKNIALLQPDRETKAGLEVH